jgi:hypothetical protein
VPRVTAFNLRPGDDLAALEQAIFAALVSVPERRVRVALRSYPIRRGRLGLALIAVKRPSRQAA